MDEQRKNSNSTSRPTFRRDGSYWCDRSVRALHTGETPTEIRRDKRRPQYQANSPEVQAFYRVNRYPAK